MLPLFLNFKIEERVESGLMGESVLTEAPRMMKMCVLESVERSSP